MTAEPRYSQEQWEQLLEASIAEIRRLATLKGGEYAGDVDRLANFRRNAQALGLLPEQVWAVYAGKHWDAISQYCKDLGAGKQWPRAESISGRLDDLIVYSLLMKAMVEEREAPAPSRVLALGVNGIPYAPGPRQAIAERPAPVLTTVESSQRPKLLDPSCPSTGEAHLWSQMDRWTDVCVAPGCGKMRPHERRGR